MKNFRLSKNSGWLNRFSYMLPLFGLFFLCNNVEAQVYTRVLDEKDDINEYIPWYFTEEPTAKFLDPLELERLLSDIDKNDEVPNRFGVKVPTSYTVEDGNLYRFGNYSIWKIKIASLNAKSLNFVFSDLFLPQRSSMVMHSSEGKIIHGPISEENIKNGRYASDILVGDETTIEIFLPEGEAEKLLITIESVTHGIQEEYSKAWGDSQLCNVNVSCLIAAPFQDEVDAVCLILQDNEGWCTGTLLNNECNDFTPFLLTANHCITDIDNITDWVFRFNYQSLQCPSPGTPPHPSIWVSFTGAQFRASSSVTDFALLQLDDSVLGTDGINFAGWNRTATIPTTSTFIHHPEGDGKKISIDGGAPVIDASPPSDVPLSPMAAFRCTISNGTSGDIGIVESGSSGSGQFDSAGRLVGQLWGGQTLDCTNSGLKWYGRFFNSWTGGGTNTTRLRNWLGPSSTPTTTNTLLQPEITGSDIICNASETYTLINSVPGYTVTWAVTPTGLFGSSTSGSGTTANLYAASFNSQGAAVLTYTLTSPTCGTQTFTKSLWVGKPSIGGLQGPTCYVVGSNVNVSVAVSGTSNITWTFPTCPNGPPNSNIDPDCWFNYTGNGVNSIFLYVGQQTGSISVWATNKCGTTSKNYPVELCTGGPGGGPIIKLVEEEEDDKSLNARVRLYPNPTSANFFVSIDEHGKEACKFYQADLLNGQGIVLKSMRLNKADNLFLVNGIMPGLYWMRIQCGSSSSVQKIIIE